METIRLTDTFIRALKPGDERYLKNENDKRYEIRDEIVRFMFLRVSATGKKTFVVRYGAGGRRHTIGTFPEMSLGDARKDSKNTKLKFETGEDPAEKKRRTKAKRQKFSNVIDLYLDRHLPLLKNRTRNEYHRLITQEIRPVLGNIMIRSIDRGHIIRMLDVIVNERKLKTTANRVRSICSSIFSFAMNRDLVDYNPVITVKKVVKETKRDRVYTSEEIFRLWNAFEEESEPIRSLFKILLLCGQRSTETRTMKWGDLRDWTWTIEASETKADRRHTLPLPKMAQEIIGELKEYSQGKTYVFASPRSSGDEPIGWIQKAAKRIRDCSGVDDFRVHDLRRTAASNMARLGINRTVLGKLLNHSGLSGENEVTAIYDRYDYQEEKKMALSKWADALQEILKTEKVKAEIKQQQDR